MQANILVAIHAQGEQILLGIVAQTAAWVEVMNLELGRTAAVLEAPAVPLQHLLAKSTVGVRIEAESGEARVQASHEAFLSCSKNCFCCGRGRN